MVGDDDAKNSIGKSSALMVVDFVFGGNSFLEDKSGVINEFGSHSYNFCFIFSNVKYFYSRSVNTPEIIYVCDEKYEKISEISLDYFKETLKVNYNLNYCESSFRDLISPFSRIWGKDNINTDCPFNSYAKESSSKAINRLIDIFGLSGLIIHEKNILDNLLDEKSVLLKSMKANIIPDINSNRYKDNQDLINVNFKSLNKIKQSFGDALAVYETLFDENLNNLQSEKNNKILLRNNIKNKIKRIEDELGGITTNLSENISLIQEFFPNINVRRLQEVEEFHKKISVNVKKQLKEELKLSISEKENVEIELNLIEKEISGLLKSKGMPNDLFGRVFELKENTDRALIENSYYDKKIGFKVSIRNKKEDLKEIYNSIFKYIEGKVNLQLDRFNRVVYGPKRKSSKLLINKENSFVFSSQLDTGTGKSYAGLIAFDLAMLKYTNLPIVIHDSIIYKNIEIDAIKNILRILSSINRKQIFISFDESKKYGVYTECLIAKHTVLKIGNSSLLYVKDWRGLNGNEDDNILK